MVLIQPRTFVRSSRTETYTAERYILGMIDGEAPSGLQAMSRGLGVAAHATILVCAGWFVEEGIAATLLGHIVERDASAVADGKVADAYVAHGVTLDAGYEAGVTAIDITDIDMADADILDR